MGGLLPIPVACALWRLVDGGRRFDMQFIVFTPDGHDPLQRMRSLLVGFGIPILESIRNMPEWSGKLKLSDCFCLRVLKFPCTAIIHRHPCESWDP